MSPADVKRVEQILQRAANSKLVMKYIFVTGGVVSSLGKGLTAAALGTLLENRGLEGHAAKVRSLPQRRSRHDEPLPARRSLCAGRRRGNRPRPRPLRALHQRQAHPHQQPDQRPGLSNRPGQGAARRLSRQNRPGHSARHGRNQAPHPSAGGTIQGGRRHHRNRRHDRRHRGPAVSRGHPRIRAAKSATTTPSSCTSPTCRSSRPRAN